MLLYVPNIVLRGSGIVLLGGFFYGKLLLELAVLLRYQQRPQGSTFCISIPEGGQKGLSWPRDGD